MTVATDNFPPFSGDRPRCASCGHKGAHTDWHPGWPTANIGEYLQRHCARCGFFWGERLVPADAPEPAARLTLRQRITRRLCKGAR
ncbi:hypothetical protein ACFV6B_13235 [Streptomyces microflavus]|uniref:hypothetical protein n=1 Tax=Streptomyces microflavus TaxID=1919 RepID=UPI0036504324